MYDDEIEASLIKIRRTLNALGGNKRRTGIQFRGRTEDKLLHLQRQVAEIKAILDRRMLDKLH